MGRRKWTIKKPRKRSLFERYREYTIPAVVAGLIIAGSVVYFITKDNEPSQEQSLESQATITDNTITPSTTEPTNTNTVQPPPPPAPVATPHSVLGLTRWRLTLPIDTAHNGNPDEISQPELAQFSKAPYFRLTDSKDGVIFQAHAGGATTKNSSYPRSELREMTSTGAREASWSNTSGTHTMTIKQAITHLPTVKPHVVAGQIHDSDDDVIMIRLQDRKLFVEAGGKDIGELNGSYSLGSVFTVKIVAEGSRIKVYYNDNLKVDYAKSGSGYYFKAGCYTQSNTERGDAASAYGEVIIYSLNVSHS